MCAHTKSLQSCPTLWLYGLWPARLLCQLDSPGKNTLEVAMQGLPDLGIKSTFLMPTAMAGGCFTISTTQSITFKYCGLLHCIPLTFTALYINYPSIKRTPFVNKRKSMQNPVIWMFVAALFHNCQKNENNLILNNWWMDESCTISIEWHIIQQ